MKTPSAPAEWKLQRRELLNDTGHLALWREHVSTPTRPDGVSWMVVRRRSAVVVAPQWPDGSFTLIRQERVAVARELWEFPAGQVDAEPTPEAILEAAHRELGEETGLACASLTPLGMFFSSPGFTDEHAHLFLAGGVALRPDLFLSDAHEVILEVKAFSPAELRRMIAESEIVDANTLAVYARLRARGLLD